MKRAKSGGGWGAIWYSLRMARKVGLWRLWQAMTTKNTCKTCALGMGGQRGGMRNELGYFPEVCKKSFQAMVADMQQGLRPEFFEKYSLRELQALSSRELEWCGRLTQPLLAEPDDTHFRVIEWEEALARVSKRLKQSSPAESFFYASGRSSNEAGFLLQLFARLFGTNYVNNCSYYCHQASGVGLKQAVGTGTATVVLEDVEKADLFILIGANPSSNHPRLMRTLMNIRRRGGKVIVVNPAKEVGLLNFSVPSDWRSLLFGSPIASLYVQPHIGGDMALLAGVGKVVLESNTFDESFLRGCTEGFGDYRQFVTNLTWNNIEQSAGVDRATITRVAKMYSEAKNVIFGWAMGITHHEHGVENVQSIVNVALLRGMVGRPNAGLLPIRGHSNVQGVGSVGVTPALKKAIFDRLEEHLQVKLPTSPGLDTMGCMQAADRGEIRTALCLGGNLYGSNPHASFAHQALQKIDHITYLSTTLNTGHVWGRGRETLILPVRARDEEPDGTTQESMFNFVRLSNGGPSRLEGPRTEAEIIANLGDRVFGDTMPINWDEMQKTCNVRQLIAKVIPGFEQLANIDDNKHEFHIPGRHLNKASFPTPTGKAKFHAHPLPSLPNSEGQLRLMTVRSEGQFNTVVYEEEDIYRGQERRDIILMNRRDIDRLSLQIDQPVLVQSEAGSLSNILVREFDIRQGNAVMYFPEANALVPATTDPSSKTPAFKSVVITVKSLVLLSGAESDLSRQAGRHALEIVSD